MKRAFCPAWTEPTSASSTFTSNRILDSLGERVHVNTTSYNRQLLLTGEVPSEQDKQLAENNQVGVNSIGYTPGPYSDEAEMLARRFTDWYCDKAREYVLAHGKG